MQLARSTAYIPNLITKAGVPSDADLTAKGLPVRDGALGLNTSTNTLYVRSGGSWQALGGSGGVTSFNTRTGAVVPASGDYTPAQVGAYPSTTTLDAIAAAVADVSLNSHGITGLRDAAANGEALRYEQLVGAIIAPKAVAPAGLTGATAASRIAGATATGAPTSGTFAVGDLVIDQTGKLWICTSAGTPGTWAQVGAGGSLTTYHSTFDIVSTAAETNMLSRSIPGNTLGANGSMLMVVNGFILAGNLTGDTATIRIKLGATTLWGSVSGALGTTATQRPFYLIGVLSNSGATNAQKLAGHLQMGPASAGSVAGFGTWTGNNAIYSGPFYGSSAVDTTSAQTLALTAQLASSSANLEIKGDVSVLVIP